MLLKPGPLTPAERREVNRHPGVGADLVRGMHTLDDVRPLIRHHHERWDGSGYPDGLRGEAIPLGARIMAVVDVVRRAADGPPLQVAAAAGRTLDMLKAETRRRGLGPGVVQRVPGGAAGGGRRASKPAGWVTADE